MTRSLQANAACQLVDTEHFVPLVVLQRYDLQFDEFYIAFYVAFSCVTPGRRASSSTNGSSLAEG